MIIKWHERWRYSRADLIVDVASKSDHSGRYGLRFVTEYPVTTVVEASVRDR